ncbi:type III-B CRISPR module RAMP protein Cmr4 [Psychrobacter sp. Pi2-1]|uniref:type III-B CRISPR module RAMP protein Cmr4 n=1 Tax=Psychrobacter sp. Pi2-1 TaxID=2774131 RepID=UPI00191A475F|nr:type III-B CRISPR module RAMP protein Cmr4 [Psychrobacter sp. Pi2-1]
MQTQIFHLQNLSALHVGTGQGVGVVDLPIARAKSTNLPLVPGSAIKGVLRDELAAQELLQKNDIQTLFGPDNALDDAHAGAIAFGDANLLLLPIRSFGGTVAYATCPFILRQYKRDSKANLENLQIPQLDGSDDNTVSARVIADSSLMISGTGRIALEDLDIQAYDNDNTQEWADAITESLFPENTKDYADWRAQVAKRFVILPDDIFSFLADTATEVRTRIRIDRKTRTVQQGALWTEENLPADSVFWGVLGVSQSRKKSDDRSAQDLADLLPKKEIQIQIGGKHTVGRGFCRLLLSSDNTQEA